MVPPQHLELVVLQNMGTLSDSSTVKIHLSLKERNHDQLVSQPAAMFNTSVVSCGLQTKIADSVSDPSSPEYGHYLTKAQIDDLTQPLPAQFERVQSWLESHGLTGTRNGSNLDVEATAVPARSHTSVPFM
jgi:subtilase family serine protease